MLPVLVAVLAFGLVAGVALPSRSGATEPTTDTTQPAAGDTTATTPDTTAGPATTVATPTTTDTTSTTAPTPTTTETTTDGTTTGQTTTGTTTQPPIDQTTTQLAPATTTNATPPPPPTAPCDTTQLTCGNNAATQIAIVSQNCAAQSNNSSLSVDVKTVEGSPVNNFTINHITSCLNELSITQVVQQFCIGCSIVVVPPPPPQSALMPAAPAKASPARAAYCMPYPVLRLDGTVGSFVDLQAGEPSWNPRWAGATPAHFDAATGYSCADGKSSASSAAPVFTLTVPASFVGQFVNLCIQSSDATQKPSCHQLQIDNGATITIPVTANIAATVTQRTLPAALRDKSPKQIAATSRVFSPQLGKRPALKGKKGKR
jgi:hypothetical protein